MLQVWVFAGQSHTQAFYEMTVDLLLRYALKQLVRTSHFRLVRRSVSLNMIDAWGGRSTTLQLLQSTTENKGRDALVQVHYLKVQPQSPEFTSKYEGINQNIEIELSTLFSRHLRGPVIALYDFIVATFVPSVAFGRCDACVKSSVSI